ncbi:MAG TPA: ABC transporter permease [Bryobacteraceae bacterium]|jgi:putative ABC transport system permease protein|nr:ABC transporter permease [Bryobacteraceae bacterium]
MKLHSMPGRLLALFRRRKLDQEVDDEILAHLELAELDARAAGLTPEESRQAARRNFGGIEQMKEDHRDHRSVPWMENLVRDFRYGMGSLARDPGFAVVAIGLLALGIGANSAMFSIVDAVLLKPLPFPEPERMVRLWESTPQGHNGTTTLTFLDWKRQDDLFDAVSVENNEKVTMATGGDPIRVSGKEVSADYFQVFGVRPQIGRTFARGEDQPGAARVVVLSNAFWRTQFASDPGILKRELVLDGEPHRIIGVLPTGSFDRDDAVFWKPMIFAPDQMNRGQHWLTPIARLRSGVTIEQARAKMTMLRASLNAVIYQKDWGFTVEPFARLLVGDTLRRSIYLAFGAVLMVLLIACANVANLMLTRGTTRRKEMAVRAALGASRSRLIVQLLTESFVLCLLGGAAGVALGALLLHALTPLVRATLPFTADLSMDLRVLGFAAAAVMAVLILTGLLPSLRTSFGGLSNVLNQAARGSSGSSATVRRTIVIGEVAASVVLICGAALLFKSLERLQEVDAGVRIDRVITMSIDLPSSAYPSPRSAARFYETVVQRLQAVPGVEQASVSQGLPLQGVQWGEYMRLPEVQEPLLVRLKFVDSWYFRTLQIPVEAGRGLEYTDRAGAPPVVVINQEVARYLSKTLGIANPVGRMVGIDVPGYGPIPEALVKVQIVGIIRSERTAGLNAPPELVAYMPLAQSPQQDIKLVIRTLSAPAAAMPAIREAVRQIDPNLALGDVMTMKQVKEQSVLWARQPTWVVGAFAVVAALMAALGLYGVLAHAVTQQRREIGIRMAVGASSGNVLAHILRGALSMLIVGLAGGLAGAFALTRVLKSLLFQVSALDPAALAVACVLMTLVGILAAWIPANRAARVDPMTVLRDEG